MYKRLVLISWLAAFVVATPAFAYIFPPVHIGDADPASEGFTIGDRLPVESRPADGMRSFTFGGVQRYKVDLEQVPTTWTMSLRGSVSHAEGHGLGVAISVPGGTARPTKKAVTLRWPNTAHVTDLETTIPLDATMVHTYQIVYDGKQVSLYIDGVRAIETMALHDNGSIGADALSGYWIGSFASIGASQSSWSLWKLDEGVHVVERPKPPVATPGTQPLEIGSRLELFVDDWLIDRMSGGVSLKLHTPEQRDTVLRFDKPWEGRWSGYVSVIKDDDRYRMYYRAGLQERPRIDDPESICTAESTDGIHWTKPELDLYEFEGTKQTNIVWRGVGSHCGFGVFKDANPNCKPEERYKALSSNGYNKPVWAFGSPDGYRWHLLQEDPVITERRGARIAAAYDSHFCNRWDPVTQRYVTYHRIWYRPFGPKVRSVATRSSADFINWTPLKRLDFGPTQPEHIYTSGISPYPRASHILLGFPRRFWPHRKRYREEKELLFGVSDTCFMSSRDGLRFDRRFMKSFLRPGRERLSWLSRSNTVAQGIILTAPDEISLFVSHGWANPSQHVRRYVIRTDGFVSAHAKYAMGELLTKPLIFNGNRLVVNFATSAAGSIRVEIQDEHGQLMTGFGLADCPEFYGDEIGQAVEWENGSDVSALSGKPVRLRFVMKDADLYSIQFAE